MQWGIVFLILLVACTTESNKIIQPVEKPVPPPAEVPPEEPELQELPPIPPVERPVPTEPILPTEPLPPQEPYQDYEYPYIGNGPVVVVHYADFGSGVNSRANIGVIAALKRDFVTNNKIKLVYMPVPTQNSRRASHAGLCMWEQGSKQFWSYSDTLFTYFARLDESSLSNYINRVPNVDKDEYLTCMASNRFEGQITKSINEASELAIDIVPTIMVNDESLSGELRYTDVKKLVGRHTQ